MKAKKIYINSYNFYVFNCWLIISAIIFLAASIFLIPIFLFTPIGVNSSIIGGANGPSAIYIAGKFSFMRLVVMFIIFAAIWIELFIKYKKNKDCIKSISPKRTIVYVCLTGILAVITGSMLLVAWSLCLDIIMFVLWNSKRFEVINEEDVK